MKEETTEKKNRKKLEPKVRGTCAVREDETPFEKFGRSMWKIGRKSVLGEYNWHVP